MNFTVGTRHTNQLPRGNSQGDGGIGGNRSVNNSVGNGRTGQTAEGNTHGCGLGGNRSVNFSAGTGHTY